MGEVPQDDEALAVEAQLMQDEAGAWQVQFNEYLSGASPSAEAMGHLPMETGMEEEQPAFAEQREPEEPAIFEEAKEDTSAILIQSIQERTRDVLNLNPELEKVLRNQALGLSLEDVQKELLKKQSQK
ncbi:hypothetical protein HDU96_005351, partial [Phlyctochytrium bullatum]